MSLTVTALWLTGAIQLVIAAANLEVAQRLNYRSNLSRLSPIMRQVFLVHAAYIVLIIVGFALLCLLFAPRLADGDPMMRAITAGLACFWGARAVIQATVYDKQVRRRYRREDVAFLLACACLAAIFLMVALR